MEKILSLSNVDLILDSKKLIDKVSFSIYKNEKLAILGSNGSGKSLLIDCIMGYLPYTGEINFNMNNSNKFDKKKIGFLFDSFSTISLLKVGEILNWLSCIYACSANEELINLLNISPLLEKKFSHLSKGENKKIGIYSALFHKPELILLDEPTDGLDPKTREIFWSIVSQRNSTIIFTTHIWSEIEDKCDKVIFMNNGNILNTPKSPKDLINNQVEYDGKIVLNNLSKEFIEFKQYYYYEENLEQNLISFYFKSEYDKNKIIKALVKSGRNNFSILDIDLNDTYLLLSNKKLSDEEKNEKLSS